MFFTPTSLYCERIRKKLGDFTFSDRGVYARLNGDSNEFIRFDVFSVLCAEGFIRANGFIDWRRCAREDSVVRRCSGSFL